MTLSKNANVGGLTYAQAGVDIDAGNALVEAIKPLAKSTARPGADGKLGGFGALFDLKAAGYSDPILVAANDGVGTKVKLAIETGIHHTIGIDLVAMCVNDLIVQGAEPLFFLDYFACGKLDVTQAEAVVSGIAEGCRQAGAALIGGETAEMPGLYSPGDFDLAGFSVGAVDRNKILPREDIFKGDILIGLGSSGAHSNGFSLIRHLVSKLNLNWTSPAPFSPHQTLGEAFLSPTKIYVQPVLQIIQQTNFVKAIAHITGGGLPENLPRVIPAGLSAKIDLAKISVPPVFQWIADTGNIETQELLRTFNCGVGMVLVTSPSNAPETISRLIADGQSATIIGELSDCSGDDRVNFKNALEL